MELIRGEYNIRPCHKHCMLAIGNFDGVHLGHQYVLKKVVNKAKILRVPSMVMIFEPQPMEYFYPQQVPARLTSFRDKYLQFSQLHIDYLLCIPFNSCFARYMPEDFIKQLIINKLAISCLVIGNDFRFGVKRSGDLKLLLTMSKQYGFNIVTTPAKIYQGTRISSTAIRAALAKGYLKQIYHLLGREFSFNGRVIHGNKLGSKLGIPTANIVVNRLVTPAQGVFLVRVAGITQEPMFGVANIGNKPTIGGKQVQLEVHLFNYQADIYGCRLTISLITKLREEKKFISIKQLIMQIHNDIDQAQQYLTRHKQSILTTLS